VKTFFTLLFLIHTIQGEILYDTDFDTFPQAPTIGLETIIGFRTIPFQVLKPLMGMFSRVS
jgi:hypothetical protein